MKNRSLLLFLVTALGGFLGFLIQPVNSAAKIIKCTGNIPELTACLIEANTYKIDTYRIDICKESPFPAYRSSADYAGAGCMTLFNGNGDLFKRDLSQSSSYKIPTTGRDSIKSGKYKYLTMVLKNGFTSSGKYTSGNTTWRTLGPNVNNLETSKGEPIPFTVKLNNWRGSNDSNNDYCDNNGGTFSRCEMNYNGYDLTGIGLGSDFIETYGKNVTYMFYMVELSSPIILKKDFDGYFDLKVKANLEVYGNGSIVQSISTAPFIFQATYINNQ